MPLRKVALGFAGCALMTFGRAAAAEVSPSLAAEAVGTQAVEDAAEETPVASSPKASEGEAEFWEAMKWFRSKAPADLAAGRAALEEAAAKEFTHAQLFLGECHQSGGYGYAQNLKKAVAYFRLAAERGNAFAKVSYGICLFSGMGGRKDQEKAMEWLTAAVAEEADYARPQPPADFFAMDMNGGGSGWDGGIAGAAATDPVASAQARAHYLLGVMLESRKNLAEAQTHYVAAATAGVAGRDGVQQAATQAAINFAVGNGVPRDPQKAGEMLEHSRKLGRHSGISTLHNYATAKLVDDFAVSELEEAIAKASDDAAGEMQLNIARLLTDRKSKDYNPAEAVRWFELAAESGKAWAMLELAMLYTRGELGAPEPEKAFAWFERVGSGDKPKHYLGVANLIICHQNGIGTVKDLTKARELALRYREEDLVSHLTLLGECPTAVITFEQGVELNKTWAGKRNDPHAQFLMGVRSEGGFGVKPNPKGAVNWYKKAMKAKHGPAARQLGLLYETKGEALGMNWEKASVRAVECYRAGAAAGDARATAFLANMAANGAGTRRNEAEAKALYEQSLALEPDMVLALNNLGALYERRFREAQARRDDGAAELNRVMMMSCYEKADAGGYGYATNNLGRLHYEGVLGKRDLPKAYGYFERAAEKGHREARFQLGEMHEKGEGVPVTAVEAAYHYRLAALDGHRGALQRLVDFYLKGKGGAQDMERAQFWLGRLYESGDYNALATYADLALGQGRHEEAVKLFEYLKNLDSRRISGLAYDRLSRCYRDGLGVKARPSRAEAYRKKALERGSVDALFAAAMESFEQGNTAQSIVSLMKIADESPAAAYQLGQMYYHGEHLLKDMAKAMGYLRKAGAMGDRDALYFMAARTFDEVKGAPALDEAITFAQAAEAVGHPEAATLREKLEERRKTGSPKPMETASSRST